MGDLWLRHSDNEVPLGHHPIPVISLRGGAGPRVLILGGTHGDEFEGPAAIMRLAARLDPGRLAGQVVLIPALNAPAFAASARVSPLDRGNLNRAFPGDPDGGPTAMIADFVQRHLLPDCAAAIDLHSGGKASVFAPCTLATRPAGALGEANLALAGAFGLPLLWQLGPLNDDRSVNAAAQRAGVPMIAAELGGGGGVDPAITDAAETGLLRCLAHLGMVAPPDGEVPPPRRVTLRRADHSVHAPFSGLFDRRVSAGQAVRAGEPAGTLHFPGEPERPSLALPVPADGIVLAHTARGLVRRGEMLALVAQPVPPGDA